MMIYEKRPSNNLCYRCAGCALRARVFNAAGAAVSGGTGGAGAGVGADFGGVWAVGDHPEGSGSAAVEGGDGADRFAAAAVWGGGPVSVCGLSSNPQWGDLPGG